MKRRIAATWLFVMAAVSMRAANIPSLLESGEGLTIVQVAPQTGHATFASSNGRGILLPVEAATSAEVRAKTFLDLYGHAFGIASSSQFRTMRAPEADALGVEHVRMQQVHRDVPVRGGEFLVHMRGSRVMAANGHVLDDLPENVTPSLHPEQARTTARQLIEKYRRDVATHAQYSEPQLEILNRAMLSDTVQHRSRLAWFIEASGTLLREYIWIDAQSGVLLLHFSQLTEAKSRRIYNGGHLATLPGTLVRSEGGAVTGDSDQDKAYDYAGATYDYYSTNHSRDSYDNLGSIIHSTAHHCPDGFPQGTTCPTYQNAFWNGSQMVYADGFSSADDVVAHELTHAVTETSANLLYYQQSGALNESFSDIFGETVDLVDSLGNDTVGVRWKLGEDVPVGAIRDMMNPNTFGDPAKMSDAGFFFCATDGWTNPNKDRGGVHINSGIPNHAYALMVDGGTYNSQTITGIGLTKAAKIQYRTLTTYLVSGSTFLDNYNALKQSCTDLIGTAGITSGDCTEVNKALLAVEMNATWGCSGATVSPYRCISGSPTNVFSDTFESVTANWTLTNTANGGWNASDTGFAHAGTRMAFGANGNAVSDHRLTMTNAVVVPANGKLAFDHAFEFENDIFGTYDGGVVEYSTNGGSVWNDAASLMVQGQRYNGTVASGFSNPLATRSAYVATSFGYTGTRLNLATLAGQSVKIRFRIGTDSLISSLGWVVDNFAIYSCTAAAFTDDPLIVNTTKVKLIHINELRARINALRVARGLSEFSFTDPTLTTSTVIQDEHILELRTALAAVYTNAAVTQPVYTDVSLAGVAVKAIHIAQLRAAVVAIE